MPAAGAGSAAEQTIRVHLQRSSALLQAHWGHILHLARGPHHRRVTFPCCEYLPTYCFYGQRIVYSESNTSTRQSS